MSGTATRGAAVPGGTEHNAAGTVVILGLGVTGLSCARYLSRQGFQVLIADSRQDPPCVDGLRTAAPNAALHTGGLDVQLPGETVQLVVSPGLALDLPVVQEARRRGIEIVGDIELFARSVNKPVAAITGSNGKSTVTTMVAQIADRIGRKMPAGGNLGTPALDLLGMPAEAYILELSSFQLELTESLRPKVASVLNLSADHIDRHGSMADYAAAKARIFNNAEHIVINRGDARVMALAENRAPAVSFGLDTPAGPEDYGIREIDNRAWMARGTEALMPADGLPVPGSHNVLNALAALAIAEQLGLKGKPALAALRDYRGLPHRTQLVTEIGGVRWIDDSKSTNVGAALAAIRGMDSPVVLIAGGDGKGADFTPLAAAVREKARAVILLGRDARRLAQAIGDGLTLEIVASMDDAVATARRLAERGDVVLLSPACASLDMFTDYAERGDAFRRAVLAGDA